VAAATWPFDESSAHRWAVPSLWLSWSWSVKSVKRAGCDGGTAASGVVSLDPRHIVEGIDGGVRVTTTREKSDLGECGDG
jgi:hypothetical protein